MAGQDWTLEHLALACADMGVFAWDVVRDELSWSARVFELLGVDGEQRKASFELLEGLLQPDDWRRLLQKRRDVLQGQSTQVELEFQVIVRGKSRWLYARGRVLRSATGEARKVAGVVQDVTERHVAESAQLETAALMRAALDASLFAAVVLEPSGQIVYCNEQAAELLGLTRSSVESRTFDAPQWKHTDMDGGPWLPEQQPFVRVMKTGAKVVGVEHRIERPDGRSIALRINGAPIKNESGQIRLVVFSFEDITERRAIEEGFRQSQKMEAIGRLAAGVAHDFNNLLTVILSSAELAMHSPNSVELVTEMLDAITEAGERAAALTKQLLAVGRKGVIRPVAFEAASEVSATVRLIERLVGERVRVRLIRSDEPLWLRMDPGHLQQVLINLAVNARDAMRHGGTLTLTVERKDPKPGREGPCCARICVRDDGSGMDLATQARAFEPFFTTKPTHEGTGLGLSTCQSIIAQAGGTISLESEPGRGTTVEICLPLADVPEPVAAAPEARRASGVHGKLLIVEDDPSVRYVARRALEGAGYEVRVARDVSEALLLCEQQRFDLVICDVELPDGSGPVLIHALREHHPRLRVLYTSGFGLELAESSDEPFLPKPYSSDALLAQVAGLLA